MPDDATEPVLLHRGGPTIAIPGSAGRIEIWVFTLAGQIPDREMLRLLHEHVWYHNDYAGHYRYDLDRHGPYRHSAIDTDSFTATSTEHTNAQLHDWLQRHGPLDDFTHTQLQDELHPLLDGSVTCHQLTQLETDAHHTGAPAVTDYLEFVVRDAAEGTVTLVVLYDEAEHTLLLVLK